MALLLLSMVFSCALAQTKLPEGTLLYWGCDGWEGSGWRDNEWNKGGSGHIHFDAEEPVYGKASLRIDGRPEGSVSALSLERPAAVQEGEQHVLQVWTKTRGVKGRAQIRALAHGPKPGEQYRPIGWVHLSDKVHYYLPADEDWTRHIVSVKALPGGATRVFFYLQLEGEGTVWFDEFSFAKAGVEVPLGGQAPLSDEDYAGIRLEDNALPENLLKNGGFEEGTSGWEKRPAGYSAQLDTAEAHSGEASFRFDAREFTDCHIVQRVSIDPRRYYEISLWAKSEGLRGYFYTHLLPFNRHGVPIGWHGANHASEHHYVTGKTKGWERRVLTTRFSPQTHSMVIFPRVTDAIGTVWLDDIAIKPLPLDYRPGGDGK